MPGSGNARISSFIAGFLLLQTLMPLRYYLGDDPYDERFSWRMFSAVRVVRCRTHVVEKTSSSPAPRPLQLTATIHEAWVTTLGRNRASVIRAFLRQRCDEPDVSTVTLTNQCVDAARQPLPPIVWERDCSAGVVDEPDDPYPRLEDGA